MLIFCRSILNFFIRYNPIKVFKHLKKETFYLIYKVNKPRIINQEFKKLLSNQEKNIIIFYDLTHAPLTYGDFILIIYLYRFLKSINFSSKIYINLENELCNIGLSKQEYVEKVNFRKELLKLVSNINDINLQNIILSESLEEINNNDYLFLSSLCLKKKSIYKYIHDFNNKLYKEFKNKSFLLNKENFANPHNLDFEYITIAFRHNRNWGKSRNSEIKDFQKIIHKFKKFYAYKIMVVSNKEGCNYLKNIFKKDNFTEDLLFSKDFTISFYEDWGLILNSKIFFQFNAGGLATLAMYSNIPYLVYGLSRNESNIKKDSICYWSKQNQIKRNSININNFLGDIELLKNL